MRVMSIAKYFIIMVGAGLLVVAFFLYQNSQTFVDKAASTEGTVVGLMESRSEDSITYRPVVQYTPENGSMLEFTSSAGSNPPNYSRGQRIEVLYDPANPANARIKSFFSLWGAPLILAGLGALCFISGAGAFVFSRLAHRSNQSLMENGLRIDTQFQGVERNTAFSINGKYPYQVVAQWLNPSTNQVHVFKSQNIWFDPSSYINTDTIAVFVEPGNFKKHHVDLSFLPKLA
ncbi:uncharacterized protein DUF3592 [Vreelandella songnenensis]|uniref:Uncharacterized protein DUF3592 n=1 Tax=Vreelandella songnenensis TaxID=1176243 RepID=A0A2T0V6L6_9GAMM|nr:DUF3592 domain-containing protein [Halomonas songnenensis]PRY65813.1 uncharacterized protein DUF3592 [Halomonas songnenensis]